MTTNEKDDFVNPIETNIDNKHMLEGLNNEKNPEAILEGGDNEVGLPSIQEKKPVKKEDSEEPDNNRDSPKPEIQSPQPEIDSPKPEIKNPDTETIIKEIEGKHGGGDKVDIHFPSVKSTDSIIEETKQ